MASKKLQRMLAYGALLLGTALFVAPFLWMVSTSLKHEAHIFARPGEPPQWIPKTERIDSQGRTLVTYNDGTAVNLGLTDAGYLRLFLGDETAGIDELPQDDPRFVEGGHGTRRGVGAEQQSLVLRGRGRPLDHDRRELTALLPPAAQAFEAIDDLVVAVADRRDAQGQLGPLVDFLSRRARSQRPV